MSISFNHTIKPKTLSQSLNDLIDTGLLYRRSQEPERDYIGMSELGDPCLRRVYYNAVKAPRKPLQGRMIRIFDTGHCFEDMMADWLRTAGFELETIDPETGKQYRVVQANGKLGGGIDGVFINGPIITSLVYPALWENKALKNSSWRAIVKHGLEAAEPKYYGQIQLYMGYFELENTLFTTINKDTEEIFPQIIPYNQSKAQEFSDMGVSLVRSVEMEIEPQRLCPSAAYFETKMCGFADHCWKSGRK